MQYTCCNSTPCTDCGYGMVDAFWMLEISCPRRDWLHICTHSRSLWCCPQTLAFLGTAVQPQHPDPFPLLCMWSESYRACTSRTRMLELYHSYCPLHYVPKHWGAQNWTQCLLCTVVLCGGTHLWSDWVWRAAVSWQMGGWWGWYMGIVKWRKAAPFQLAIYFSSHVYFSFTFKKTNQTLLFY